MGQAVAYGSISIIDMTDLGEFSIQLSSNAPTSVSYDPDSNSYLPNWGTQNLIITPVVYYGGSEISLNDSGLRTIWTKQLNGSSAETQMDSNPQTGTEIVSGNVLTVSANKFIGDVVLITYRVEGRYTEPQTGQELISKSQITFSLVKNSSVTKNCTIVGDSIIKLRSDGTPYTGASSVTLHVDFEGVSVPQGGGWMYQNASGNWVAYPGSSYPGSNQDGNLIVNYGDTDSNQVSVFTNDKCVIKFDTVDNNGNHIYDIHTITILRDGPAGDKIVSAILTNQDQVIPVTVSGSSETADYTDATTQIMVYEGGVNVTELWTIVPSVDQNSGVTFTSSTSVGAHSSQNDIVQVTGMTNDSGNVIFTCTRTDHDPKYDTLVKVFSLAKLRGRDGVSPTIYSLEPDSYAVNKTSSAPVVYTPSSVVFRAYSKTGNGDKIPYPGMYRVFANITYDAYKTAVASGNPPSPTLTPSLTAAETLEVTLSTLEGALPQQNGVTTPLNSFLVILFENGGFTKILDAQSVVITQDGSEGPQGQGAINVTFGNYNDTLNCNSSNQLLENVTIQIPFQGFKGTTQVACSVANSSSINFIVTRGQTQLTISPVIQNSTIGTGAQNGLITWSLSAGDVISNASGVINVTFSIEGQEITQSYSWTRNTVKEGENGVLFQIFTTGPEFITQSINSVQMQVSLRDGSTEKGALAPSAQRWNSNKWSWYKWGKNNNNVWDYLSVSNSNLEYPYKFTVQDTDVDSYASYKCRVLYTPTGGTTEKEYIAYFSVFDKTDPIQVSVFSSFGDQIVNSQGTGALYVKVMRSGQEIDQLYSNQFLTTAPTGSNGDFYYAINKTNKTATLKKHNGSNWVDATETYAGIYNWTWRDKYGNSLPTSYNEQTSSNQQYVGDAQHKIFLPTTGKVIYLDGSMIDTKIIADVEVTI